MAIDAKSDKIFELVSKDVKVEKLATGCEFTEGPVWSPWENCLYFSDMPGDKRRRWSEAGGTDVVNDPSNKCNGMTYDGAGNLYVCEHWTSYLVRETKDGKREVLASHWGDKELNSPNDVVVDSKGAVYFSDPTYGRMPVFGNEREQQLDFQGVFRIAPDGELSLAAGDFNQPNGLCFSPDEKILYINDSGLAHIRAFDVKADGSLSNGRMFLDNIGDGSLEGGIPDGMKCDEQGNVYVTGPGGIWVITPEAEHIGTIEMPEHAGNHNWGGADWKDLYCCCSNSVYRVRMNVAGNKLSYMR